MAAIIEAGDVKRGTVFNVLPHEIVVDPKENGRYIQPDLTGLIIKILVSGRVEDPVDVRKIEGNKIKLVAGYGRHGAVTFINNHLHDGELERLLSEAGYTNVTVPTEPLRLPCLVHLMNAEEAFRRNIGENRDRNNTTAIDDAHNVRRLSEQYKMSDEDICRVYSRNGKPMSPAWLGQTKKILSLSKELQETLAAAEGSAAVAYALADMPEEARAEILNLSIAEEKAAKGVDPDSPEPVKVTYTTVMKVARKKKVAKKVSLKMSELTQFLRAQQGQTGSYHCEQFLERLLGYISQDVEEELMIKEFGKKRFKEHDKDGQEYKPKSE